MEPPPIIYDTTQYIATATGNIISRQSKLNGVDKIRLSGKVLHIRSINCSNIILIFNSYFEYNIIPNSAIEVETIYFRIISDIFWILFNFLSQCILEEGVIINGEQTDITLGRYSSVGKNTTISPSPKLFKGYALPLLS